MDEIASLLAPVSEESPAGDDLEYDPAFLELERASQGKPEQVIGEHVKEAEPPDWKQVRQQAEALLSRTKDLRVAVHYTNASLYTQGWAGLRDGLVLVRELSERYWDSVHPKLDEDDGDPAVRCNALAELANPARLVMGVLSVPFVNARVAGAFSLRDLRVISGKLSPKQGETRPPPTAELISAALTEAGAETVIETADTITGALEAVTGIRDLFAGKVGEMNAPDLSRLIDEISEVEGYLRAHVSGDVSADGPAAGEAGHASGGGGGQPITGTVTSRGDVIRLLDLICDFYARAEPSSPVPLLLRRAKSLVDKDFMAIVADLTPAGLSEAEWFRGALPQSTDAGWGSGSGSEDDGTVENGGSSW